jgi:hypothetical protein
VDKAELVVPSFIGCAAQQAAEADDPSDLVRAPGPQLIRGGRGVGGAQ